MNPVETYKRAGTYAKHLLPSLPFTPGADGAGTVEAIGAGVSTVAAGDRVWLSGSVSGLQTLFSVPYSPLPIALQPSSQCLTCPTLPPPFPLRRQSLNAMMQAHTPSIACRKRAMCTHCQPALASTRPPELAPRTALPTGFHTYFHTRARTQKDAHTHARVCARTHTHASHNQPSKAPQHSS